jgi:hypothetical protein
LWQSEVNTKSHTRETKRAEAEEEEDEDEAAEAGPALPIRRR